MIARKAMLIGGLVAALAVPAGIAVAATTPAPTPSTGTYGPGYGPGPGPMMGGRGDPEDCPFYDSAEAQQWRAQREQRQQLTPTERQRLMDQHRQKMQELMSHAASS